MKFLFISILLGGFSFSTIKAEDISKKVESLKIEVNSLKTQQEHLCRKFKIELQFSVSDIDLNNLYLKTPRG